ncbi:unnamed protein product, partial [Iphiclides podalirius]
MLAFANNQVSHTAAGGVEAKMSPIIISVKRPTGPNWGQISNRVNGSFSVARAALTRPRRAESAASRAPRIGRAPVVMRHARLYL